MIGETFNRLTVIRETDKKPYCAGRVFLCRCTCGKEVSIRKSVLLSGRAKSCGCLRIERAVAATSKHGMYKTPEYKVWQGMLWRCTNPKSPVYKHYGGRGISVCNSWLRFENFWKDMGKRPSDKYELERRDNNRGYSPENCKWATRAEQAKNSRRNVYVVLNGEKMTITDAARRTGVHPHTIKARLIMGYPEELLFKKNIRLPRKRTEDAPQD